MDHCDICENPIVDDVEVVNVRSGLVLDRRTTNVRDNGLNVFWDVRTRYMDAREEHLGVCEQCRRRFAQRRMLDAIYKGGALAIVSAFGGAALASIVVSMLNLKDLLPILALISVGAGFVLGARSSRDYILKLEDWVISRMNSKKTEREYFKPASRKPNSLSEPPSL